MCEYDPTIGELTRLTLPLPMAVAKTKGIPLPSIPTKMDETALRFLIDMVASEMTEYVLAKTPAERIDALIDALVYIADSAIRHGILHLDVPLRSDKVHGKPEDVVSNGVLIYRGMLNLLNLETVDEQVHHLNVMCSRIAYYAEDDLTPYLEEVARANNSKITNDGLVVLSAAGKILKPEGFTPPNLERVWDERHE